jgi:hypothetical protein
MSFFPSSSWLLPLDFHFFLINPRAHCFTLSTHAAALLAMPGHRHRSPSNTRAAW